MPDDLPRRGLEPVPGRVPRLPGAGPRPSGAAVADSASPPPVQTPSGASATAAADGRSFRPREFQLDKESRDYLDTTAFAIRLRTETGFDRSALVRGLLRAVLRSGLDVGGRCDSEEEVTEYLLRFLPVRPA